MPSGPPPRGNTVALFVKRRFSGNVGYNRKTSFVSMCSAFNKLTALTFIETASEEGQFLNLLTCDVSFARNDGDLSLQPF